MSSKTKTTLALAVSVVCMMLLVGILSTINPSVFNFGGTSQDGKPGLTNPLYGSYDYPMDKLEPADGVITYYFAPKLDGTNDDDGTNDVDAHKYLVDAQNKVAFIDLTDCVFSKVTFYNNTEKWMAFAFLTEMPELGRAVSYATGYNSMRESSSDSVTMSIPANATVLAVYYQDCDDESFTSYVPRGITFSANRFGY